MSNAPGPYRPWRDDSEPIISPEQAYVEARLRAMEQRLIALEKLVAGYKGDLPGARTEPYNHVFDQRRNEAA
ncbi:MAG: hypothetical protein GC162_13140 [Planctomycetes bacterium]|nr:hypothetical protein [Planctomycetota bacterium]